MTTSECCCEQRDSRPGSLSRPVSSAHVPCWPCRARRLEAFDVRSARPSLARMAEQWRAGPSACMSLRTPPAPLPVSRPAPPDVGTSLASAADSQPASRRGACGIPGQRTAIGLIHHRHHTLLTIATIHRQYVSRVGAKSPPPTARTDMLARTCALFPLSPGARDPMARYTARGRPLLVCRLLQVGAYMLAALLRCSASCARGLAFS